MRYFVKYLPVEGEIEVGDKYIDEKGDVYAMDDKHHMISHRWKKAKLFLCSRDIQVGDKVKRALMGRPGYIDYEIPEGAIIEESQILNQHLIKVVAEISSKAIWLKGGEEIEDDSVKLSEYPKCPKCGAISNDGFCPEDVDCQIDKKRTVAYIKGQCGYFH